MTNVKEEVPPPITLREFEKRTGYVRATAYRWLTAGYIKGIKTPGGMWRIPVSEVERVVRGEQPEGRD